MEKFSMHTLSIADRNYSLLKGLFPNAITETLDEEGNIVRAIDADVLSQEINTRVISTTEERYQFTWPDKKKSILLANAPIAKTLRPCREESVDFDNTENLYIEGDNLEALKLLQETYLGKVKMIYIDPPYNTGNDFVYEDDFSQSASEYLAKSGQFDENDNRLVQNTESNGRFHTDWLNMIYPRLKVAKDLLSDDGVIFISIDDNELDNLKKVCNEIFGSENFVNCIAVKMSESSGVKMAHTSTRLPKLKEYVLIYKKKNIYFYNIQIPKEKWDDEYKSLMLDISFDEWSKLQLIITDTCRKKDEYDFAKSILDRATYTTLAKYFRENMITGKDEQEKFKYDNAWRIFQTVSMGGGTTSNINNARDLNMKNIFFPYVTSNNELYIIKGDYDLNVRKPRLQVLFAQNYLNYHPGDFWTDIKTTGLDNEGEIPFKNGKKPLALLIRLIEMSTTKNDIVMDFFSGSGTTAEAVLKSNNKDGGKRSFILVQIPENIESSLAQASDANTKKVIQSTLDFLDDIGKPHFITEIGKERIRRSGMKIGISDKHDKTPDKRLDVGFRVLKIDSSNMKDVFYNPEEFTPTLFDDLTDNIKEDRTSLDLLFQVMLEMDVLLSSKITETEISGKKVYSVMDDYMIACFDKGITSEVVEAIAKKEPYYAVFRDSCMADDSTMASFEQIFETYSKDTIRKVL